MKDLLKYKITIDEEYSEGEDLGISMIANTKTPAIKTKGFAFNSDEIKEFSLKSNNKQYFSDEIKYRIAGPIMIPGDIYRYDEEDDIEYEVEFTIDVIEKLHSKFMQTLNSNNKFNLEHSNEVVPSYILECILVNTDSKIEMIKSSYNIDVILGTSFLVQQFTDKDYYNKIVEEGRIGFSIEGFLGMKLSSQEFIKKPPYHESCNCTMSDGEVVTEEGVCEYCQTQSEYKKNKKESMNELVLPDGEHQIGEKVYVIKDGKVLEVKDVVEQELAAEAPVEEVEEVKEVKEEELADETPVEEVKEVKEEELADETPVETEVETVPSYSKEEVDAKFEELYKIIADLKSVELKEVVEPVKTEMSINQRFADFVRFSKQQ
jgi:hypothetical protein